MSHHILCIDDNEEFLFNMKAFLSHKYQISTTTSFDKSLDIVREDPVDLVFLDVNLGHEKDGIALIGRIKETDPTVIVVMLSGHRNSDTIVQAMKNGASDYLCKPYPHQELITIIEKNLIKKSDTDRNAALIAHYNSTPESLKMIGESEQMKHLLTKAQKLKGFDASVLIEGESGTGKEVMARYIHSLENDSNRPFIAVNCAAIPDTLIETELFGHEKGSFTGANRRKIGKFELANGGDLFLDEVNSLKPEFQAKLLRVLQEKEFYRVGGSQPIRVNVRIIAASNTDLSEAVKNGNFRQDLLYRLRVISLFIPPLRSRQEDLKSLIEHFLLKHNPQNKSVILSQEVKTKLTAYHWPGNIRELENLIQSLIIMSQNDTIGLSELPEWILHSRTPNHNPADNTARQVDFSKINMTLKEFLSEQEKHYIDWALKENKGNFSKTARILKISRSTLYNRIQKEDCL